MSSEGSDLPQRWQCTRCEMTLEKTSPNPILFCPYCREPQPGAAWEQAKTDPLHTPPDNCRHCGVQFLPDAAGCIGCGTARHQGGGQHQAVHQLSEQQMQMLQQPGMQQILEQLLMHQQRLQKQQQEQQLLQENAKQNETGERQKPPSVIQHSVTIHCECGAVFNPGARACAGCGKPLPRNQPTGPPCFYCKNLLLKPDAIKCAKCSRKQPEKATKSPQPEAGATSLPHWQQNSPPFPVSSLSPPISEIVSSPPDLQPRYNFPQMFGTQLVFSPRLAFPILSLPQSSKLNQSQGGHPLYVQSGMGSTSSPSQEQTPTSSNSSVSDNLALTDNSMGKELAQMFPGVPGTARPSKGGGVPERDNNGVNSGDNTSTALLRRDILPNVTRNSQDRAGAQSSESNREATFTTCTASCTTLTNTGSISSTISVTTTVTSSPVIQTYAGAVKVQAQAYTSS